MANRFWKTGASPLRPSRIFALDSTGVGTGGSDNTAYLFDDFTGTDGQLITARSGWLKLGADTQADMATVSSNNALFTYRPSSDHTVRPLGAPGHLVGVNKMYAQAKCGDSEEMRIIVASDLTMQNFITANFGAGYVRLVEYRAGVYAVAYFQSVVPATIAGLWLGVRYDKATEIPIVYSGDFEAGTHTDLYTFPFPGTGNEPNGFTSSGTYSGLMGCSYQDQVVTDFKCGTY